ncbi:MAG TPA: phosphoesterase [Bacteroidetes bacterium]|nr:phosphoesterase [Bacteroidota bacterium]
MQTIWFTADTHFGHKNIIRYTDRPYASVTAMDEALIANWNARIGPEDDVYHLGDFALCEPNALRAILDQLNGRIHLIVGNHERAALKMPERFVWVKDYFELVVKDQDGQDLRGGKRLICLMHYAMRVWNGSHSGSWHLYGHSHGTLPEDPTARTFDVGVDCHNYSPINYEEVKAIMSQKNWVSPFADEKS